VLRETLAHLCLFAAVALTQLFAGSNPAGAQTAARGAAELKVSGAVSSPLTLTDSEVLVADTMDGAPLGD
jgi:hypothetical protein